MNTQNKFIVISGCSGGGKSTLLTELQKNNYSVVPEIGRELVKEQLAINGKILPWQEPLLFCEELINRSVAAYNQATQIKSAKEHMIFFDRCFLEGISYYQMLKPNDKKYNHLVKELRFYSTIFMAPPWQEIFCEDSERKNSFENAVEEYERLSKNYVEYGYELTLLPKSNVEQRLQFILKKTKIF